MGKANRLFIWKSYYSIHSNTSNIQLPNKHTIIIKQSYYVDHNTKTTHWNPPPPDSALPATPPNNLTSPLSSNTTPNTSSKSTPSNFEFPSGNVNKTLPQKLKPKREHGRASTFGNGGSQSLPWNINDELKSMAFELNENPEDQQQLTPIKDGQSSISSISTQTQKHSISTQKSSIISNPPSLPHAGSNSIRFSSNSSNHTSSSYYHRPQHQHPPPSSPTHQRPNIYPSRSPPSIRSTSPGLHRKPSKPYSNTTDQLHEFQQRRMSLKPTAPPRHLKKAPSIRNTVGVKPPVYTKKNMAGTSIPPPPPRAIPARLPTLQNNDTSSPRNAPSKLRIAQC